MPALLDDDAQRRLHANPLRILDSKNPAMQAMIEDAPQARRLHRRRVARALRRRCRRLLADAGLAFTINPRLVRGLDYYNRTVFEWVATSGSLGAQGTVAGGGRYDHAVRAPGRQGARSRAASPSASSG